MKPTDREIYTMRYTYQPPKPEKRQVLARLSDE